MKRLTIALCVGLMLVWAVPAFAQQGDDTPNCKPGDVLESGLCDPNSGPNAAIQGAPGTASSTASASPTSSASASSSVDATASAPSTSASVSAPATGQYSAAPTPALPATGGAPVLALVAGLLLVGSGVVARRIVR